MLLRYRIVFYSLPGANVLDVSSWNEPMVFGNDVNRVYYVVFRIPSVHYFTPSVVFVRYGPHI